METFKLAVLAAVVLVLAASFLFLGNGSVTGMAVAQKETVKIGYLPLAAQIPFFVAVDKGFFAEEGLAVEPVKFASSNQMLEALVQGKIDAIASAAAPTAYLVNEKSPGVIRIFAYSDDSTLGNLLVAKDSAIRSVKELEGKKIGSYPGTTAVTVLKTYLERNGVDLQKVEIQQLEPPVQLDVLQSGQVAAVYAYEPTATIGSAKGISRILAPEIGTIISRPLMMGFSGLSAQFAKDKPKAAEGVVLAFRKAARYLQQDEARARLVLTKWTPLDNSTIMTVPLSPFYETSSPDSGQLAAAQAFSDFLFSEGILQKPLDVSSLFWKPQGQ